MRVVAGQWCRSGDGGMRCERKGRGEREVMGGGNLNGKRTSCGSEKKAESLCRGEIDESCMNLCNNLRKLAMVAAASSSSALSFSG
jgi:hypothetical protein